MAQEVKSFGRFFALLRKMPYRVEEEEWRGMVRNVSNGRTDRLHDLSDHEYANLCNFLSFYVSRKTIELRYRRSCVLKQMQRMGVDTTDWSRINALCMDARIAGKRFGDLSEDELHSVCVKLREIERKGGFSARSTHGSACCDGATYILIPSVRTKGPAN